MAENLDLWDRLRSRGWLELAIWTLAAISWIYLLIVTDGKLLQITVWSVPFVVMIALVSMPWRSVSWRHLVGFFMFGMGPVFLLVALSQFVLENSPIQDWTRSGLSSLAAAGFDLRLTSLLRDLWAPITEELFKVVPLLVFLWWRRTGLRTFSAPLDLAVLAGATGAGMAFAEDILVFVSQGLPGPPSSAFALGLGQIYRGLVGADPVAFSLSGRSGFADTFSFFFPEMQELLGVIWSGHGALSLGLGLSIGLAIWGVRRTGSRFFYVIPVVVYLWVVWEHVMANWYGGAACATRSSPLCTLASLELRGRLFPLAVLAAFAYAAYLSTKTIRAYRQEDPVLDVAASDLARPSYQEDGWRDSIGFYRDRFDFWRWRRKTAYGAFHFFNMSKMPMGQVFGLLASRTQTLRLLEGLQGEPATPLPEEAEQMMTRLAPLS